MVDAAKAFDALLLVSFGGPEGPEDVWPFLERVAAGRNIPSERLVEVAERYNTLGGVSPLNQRFRALARELASSLEDLPIYWGNRNAEPLLAKTLVAMADAGHKRVLAWSASPYSSHSSCRKYAEDLEAAQAAAGGTKPLVEWIRRHHDHPGLIEPAADRLAESLGRLPASQRESAVLIFSAHSIPTEMAVGCRYEAEIAEAATLVSEIVDPAGNHRREMVWQSRSGPPNRRWLEPDVADRLRELAAEGIKAVVVSPIGFPVENFEIAWDLDVEAARVARETGLTFERAKTVDDDPRFVAMITDLVAERTRPNNKERASLGALGVAPDRCPGDCCPATYQDQ
ncbi:MAG: ferrochelatase [Actinomycetota bacterium]|nr:ferrochelatase [Actinomycetota bacterium]